MQANTGFGRPRFVRFRCLTIVWESTMTDHRSIATSNGPSVFLALELSRSGWLVAIQCPSDGRVSRHKLTGGEVDGFLALFLRRAPKAQGGNGSPCRHDCFPEAGCAGLRLPRGAC